MSTTFYSTEELDCETDKGDGGGGGGELLRNRRSLADMDDGLHDHRVGKVFYFAPVSRKGMVGLS